MKRILLQLTSGEEKLLPFLKPLLAGRANVALNNQSPTAVLEVVARAKERGAASVATTSPRLLQLLLGTIGEKLPSVDDYAGSILTKYGMEFLILNPIEHIVSVPWGKHLYERYFSKILHPDDWLQMPEFTWELAELARFPDYLSFFSSCSLIAVDIETVLQDRAVTCIGFSGARFVNGGYETHTVVFPFSDEFLALIRKICDLDVPKTFQNGKYDNSYLLRFATPVRRWSFDTAHMFHSWYSEMPKRLDFITAYTLRKWQFWKDEAKTSNLAEYYAYNAKDAFGTLCSTLVLLQEMPDWAIKNFLMEFPLVYPCMVAELTGIKQDETTRQKLDARLQASMDVEKRKLAKLVGCPAYNPSSSQQTVRLFHALGSKDITNTKPASRDRVANRHPINKRIVDAITTFRKDRKLVSSYTKEDAAWLGRIFYQLNPHGTDTGRLASSESHFWCGLPIHQQPRDRKDISIKEMYIADNGFEFGEGDYEQAESRDTAYLSGDTNLIAAVESPKDFHGLNASMFFGVPYEKIVDEFKNVLDKELRDLSKRTNHGANYNMGEKVMLDTMGIQNVLRAKQLLNLPSHWTLLRVCAHLLEMFAKTYPGVKGIWYDWVIHQVLTTQMLIGPTGWTRFCFSNPKMSKHALNSYVAHPPQSLNAMTLNKAWLRIFYEVWLKHSPNFKLCAQIHDSILFQYRIGHDYLVADVRRCMEMKIPVTDCKGITRDLFVPVAMKWGSNRWNEIKTMH